MGHHLGRGIALAFLLLGSVAFAEDPPAAPAPAPEETELEGEALKLHEEEVKKLLAALNTEKNQEIVRSRIEQYGTQATRAHRDCLMRYATGNKNHEFVKHAFDALAKISGKKTIDFLGGKSALRSQDFMVQLSAAEALATMKDPRAAGPLLDALTDKTTKIEVMGAAAIAAAKVAPTDERVVETLFSLAEAKKDTIRANAMEAIGHLASDKAVALLAKILAEDKNTRVRGAAAKGLGLTKRPEAIPALERAVAEDKAFTVRDEAMSAIRMIQGS
jgi:HEAT repeat protein